MNFTPFFYFFYFSIINSDKSNFLVSTTSLFLVKPATAKSSFSYRQSLCWKKCFEWGECNVLCVWSNGKWKDPHHHRNRRLHGETRI